MCGSTQHTKFGEGTKYSFPVQLRPPVDELKWNIPRRSESWLATSNHSPEGSNWKWRGVAPRVCCHCGVYVNEKTWFTFSILLVIRIKLMSIQNVLLHYRTISLTCNNPEYFSTDITQMLLCPRLETTTNLPVEWTVILPHVFNMFG
jgi:hypothetical protein